MIALVAVSWLWMRPKGDEFFVLLARHVRLAPTIRPIFDLVGKAEYFDTRLEIAYREYLRAWQARKWGDGQFQSEMGDKVQKRYPRYETFTGKRR